MKTKRNHWLLAGVLALSAVCALCIVVIYPSPAQLHVLGQEAKPRLAVFPGYFNTSLTHVLVLIRNEQDAADAMQTIGLHWSRFPPCNSMEVGGDCQQQQHVQAPILQFVLTAPQLAATFSQPILPPCFSRVKTCTVEAHDGVELMLHVWDACLHNDNPGFALVIETLMRPIQSNWLHILAQSLLFPNQHLIASPSLLDTTEQEQASNSTSMFVLDWNNAIYRLDSRALIQTLPQVVRALEDSFKPMSRATFATYDELRLRYNHLLRISPLLANSPNLVTSSTVLAKGVHPQPSTLPSVRSASSKLLTHVVLAFHDSPASMAKLQDTINVWWKRFPPCPHREGASSTWPCARERPHLVFLMMTDKKEGAPLPEDFFQRYFANQTTGGAFSSCFASHSLCLLHLDTASNTYFTGSRLSFEAFLNKHCAAMTNITPEYGMYMEADLKPVRRNWLTALLYRVKFSAPFSVLGSSFKGDSYYAQTLPTSFHRHHINSNAVYDLQRYPDFYFNHVRPYIERTTPAGKETAMDLDVFNFLLTAPRGEDWLARAKFLGEIQYTNAFANKYMVRAWSARRLTQHDREVLLVHGGSGSGATL